MPAQHFLQAQIPFFAFAIGHGQFHVRMGQNFKQTIRPKIRQSRAQQEPQKQTSRQRRQRRSEGLIRIHAGIAQLGHHPGREHWIIGHHGCGLAIATWLLQNIHHPVGHHPAFIFTGSAGQ